MGIDPGSLITGYGILAPQGSGYSIIAAGRIKTKKNAPLPERLNHIFGELKNIIIKYRPDEVVVEEIFYAKNVKSAMALGHARGVALLAAAETGTPVYEYSPTAIKMSVVGYGRASKEQVSMMVKTLVKSDQNFGLDTTDAIAAAICHMNHIPAARRGIK